VNKRRPPSAPGSAFLRRGVEGAVLLGLHAPGITRVEHAFVPDDGDAGDPRKR